MFNKTDIIEEIQNGNFSKFNLISEEEQISMMQSWTKDTWDKFRMQNTVSKEEVFEPIFKLIDSDD